MFSRVISAKESTERRRAVEKELVKIGLVPHYFNAIMGREFSQEQLNQWAIPDNGMLPGEIGCALSHVAVLHEFLESDEKVALIFEDDIEVTNGFSTDNLQQLVSWFNQLEEPSILLLYTSSHGYKEVASLENIQIYKAFTGSMTHAYLINRAAAQKVIEIETPVRFEIDIYKYYNLLGGVSIYSLDKDYIVQQGWDSFIDEERNTRNNFVERGKIRKATYHSYWKDLSWQEKLRSVRILIAKSIWEAFFKKKGIQYVRKN